MRRRVLGAVFGLVLVAGGCGGGSSVAGSAGVVSPAEAAFSDLPDFPGAEAVGAPEEDDGVVTRSFRAAGTTPRTVINFYANELRRWEVVDPVRPIGPATFRGSWTRRGSTVVVTAMPAPAVVPGTTDFSLSLAPAGGEA